MVAIDSKRHLLPGLISNRFCTRIVHVIADLSAAIIFSTRSLVLIICSEFVEDLFWLL